MNRFILLMVCSVLFAQDMQLKQVVISSSAIQSDRLKGTVGQPAIGRTISDNYILSAGFWGSVSRMFSDVDDEVVLPTEYSISNAYPNPFNPVTTMLYDLPETGHTRLIIYDLLGREVHVLIDKVMDPGYYSTQWNGRNSQGQMVGAGVYIYQIQSNGFIQTHKMLLLK